MLDAVQTGIRPLDVVGGPAERVLAIVIRQRRSGAFRVASIEVELHAVVQVRASGVVLEGIVVDVHDHVDVQPVPHGSPTAGTVRGRGDGAVDGGLDVLRSGDRPDRVDLPIQDRGLDDRGDFHVIILGRRRPDQAQNQDQQTHDSSAHTCPPFNQPMEWHGAAFISDRFVRPPRGKVRAAAPPFRKSDRKNRQMTDHLWE